MFIKLVIVFSLHLFFSFCSCCTHILIVTLGAFLIRIRVFKKKPGKTNGHVMLATSFFFYFILSSPPFGLLFKVKLKWEAYKCWNYSETWLGFYRSSISNSQRLLPAILLWFSPFPPGITDSATLKIPSLLKKKLNNCQNRVSKLVNRPAPTI